MLRLKLTTGPNGSTAWRNLLGSDRAIAGWAAAGPATLASRLAILLGLPHAPAHPADRTAAYAARLAALDDQSRSYSASRQHDEWGVAAYLLSLRDSLRSAGWDGAALDGSPRLRDLSAAEDLNHGPLPPALPDLFHAVLARLKELDRLPVPLHIELAAPAHHFALVVRRVLDRLAELGTAVEPPPADAATALADTDLGRLQRAILGGDTPAAALRGDGSVVVLEAETPWEAAELAAAWWRDRGPPEATWVTADEPELLDAALRRRHRPILGAHAASPWRPALQVLPLRLALAFAPRDPLRAVELLSLPHAPLPGNVRHALLAALAAIPGIDSPAWREAVDRFAPGADPDAAELRGRIDDWFGGPAHDADAGIPPAEAVRLCGLVQEWARARALAAEPADPLLLEAADVARRLARMIGRLPAERPIPRLQLEELHDAAVGAGPAVGEPGEAGRPAVCGRPGAVLGPVDQVVWWGFIDQPEPAPPPWTPADRRALAAAGVELDPPGAAREVAAWGWRRPVLAARERLVLARWRLAGGGPTLAHPLEDELAVRLGSGWAEACRLTPESALGDVAEAGPDVVWQPATRPIPAAPAVRPRGLWRLPPEQVAPAPPLSPTSIEQLFACPLQHTLQRVARLRRGWLPAIREGSRLVGDFAHRLLEELLLGPALDPAGLTPDAARAWCEREFDARVEREAAPLLRPGHELERRRARETIARAGARLVEALRAGGWRVVSVEDEVDGRFAGLEYRGRLDLLLEGASGRAILDLKLGRAAYRRDELAEGRAIQLALYARAAAGAGAALPPAGFFTLEESRLLTTDAHAFPGAEVVPGPDAQRTLELAETGWAWWLKALRRGLVPARYSEFVDWQDPCAEAAGLPVPVEGIAGVEAPCKWCDYATICTVGVGEPAQAADA